MLDLMQDVFVVLGVLVTSLLLMLLLDRLWSRESRRAHNDLIGWQLSILGTTYAVILGFMLYTVWTNYGEAEVNAEAEANALLNVFRLAAGLPEQQAGDLRKAALAYATTVVNKEWPAMANEAMTFTANPDNGRMWDTLLAVKIESPTQSMVAGQALHELGELNQRRRIRQLQSTSKLPDVLWFVLIVGGVVTIASSCMFGSISRELHLLQVSSFSLLIALTLVAIADIDRPFQGAVHVTNIAFTGALQTMSEH